MLRYRRETALQGVLVFAILVFSFSSVSELS